MTPLNIANAEISKLRRQLNDALEENRRLRGQDCTAKRADSREKLRAALGLKGTGAAIVYALWCRKAYTSTESLIATCLVDKDRDGDEMVLMRNHIYGVRRDLGHGAIIAQRGHGYRLSEDMRTKVTALLAPPNH